MQGPYGEGGSPVPRLLIVEDHRAVAEGLALVLRRAGVQVLGMALTAAQALEMARTLRPNVVLIEHHVARDRSLNAIAAIKAIDLDIQVIIRMGSTHREEIVEVMDGGASGYVLKTESVDAVVATIRRAAAGELTMAPRTSRSRDSV